MTDRRPSRWGLFAAFAAIYLVWGSAFLAIRIAVRTIPPLFLGGARFLSAGALLYLWAELRREPRASALHWRSALLIGVLLLLGGRSPVLWASRHMDSGTVALLVGMVPLWMAVLQAFGFGGRRPSALAWIGLALGVAGIVVLAHPRGGAAPHPLAVVALAAGCFSWALGSLLALRFPQAASPIRSAAMQMLCGGAGLLLAGLLAGEGKGFEPSRVSPEAIAWLLYLSLFGSVVAFSAYLWLLRVCDPTLVGSFAFVNPVVAVLLGAWFGAERLDARVALAGGLIVAAVAILTLAPRSGGTPRGRPGEPPPETPPPACCQAREPSL